ncbi:PAS domain S-box-containing protein/diguanylate cyclase (GGDEF)-like protein [Desulfobotulus alkaliphilus]|uniref:PAS domain S-box-containing protein/diguanylate cyclase (GGDEF)-like protein n=1 Tax=Desulfobotulus alkaliphilus TaxID=622671 RepID=A0A562RNX6_9BACT|nr:diguanylate cyclase [Desulfobotulus alkaliphilus]TWI70749.1 PAS domain S-box-containing protein/diguanylate cyclase (GGDEF)-like protein [Desulfobotulus alkaliphilus]
MYQRLLKIFILAQDPQLESILKKLRPLEQFSHEIICQPHANGARLADCSVIILDSFTSNSSFIKKIHSEKNKDSFLIGCFTTENLNMLAEVHDILDQVWVRPFAEEKILSSFKKIMNGIKESEDASLTQRYLDTLIDSLPDLIWFKDARGSHLKVNNSFCKAVNKTKKQIQDRGHYYIWDIEPEEYAKGEYVCLESEEIVLNKKETCLFDETVKCQDELRKFKTYKSPIFDKDGRVIGTVGFAHDITDLQNLMIELKILMESLPFAVMVADRDKIITLINQKFMELFSLDQRDLAGSRIDSFIDESRKFTRSKKWIIEQEEENTLMLSQDTVLKIHNEPLLDIFGILAGYIYLFVDITLEHSHKNRLLMDANTDHLTGLNNRRSLQDFMRKTPCQHSTALLLADLDNFKEVNDQFGHDEGDRILVAFSTLLQQIFHADNLFRLGGDEFAIVLPDMKKNEAPCQYAEKILTGFDSVLLKQFPHTRVSVSIGIAIDVDDSENFGELFRRADMALYEAKNAGKSAFRFWSHHGADP